MPIFQGFKKILMFSFLKLYAIMCFQVNILMERYGMKMGKVILNGPDMFLVTPISNRFIDEYMASANGEFVKIYLYLLRALGTSDSDVSICHIADIFNHTEKDVIRALKYWEQIGLIRLNFDASNQLTNICMNNIDLSNSTSRTDSDMTNEETIIDSKNIVSLHNSTTSLGSLPKNTTFVDTDTLPQVSTALTAAINNTPPAFENTVEPKHTYTANELDKFKEKSDVMEFLYLAQKYIGKPLSGSDTNTLLYMYDGLGFDAELIEYLIEYCVSNSHKSLRYMEKVALSWASEGIDTVEKAKNNTSLYNTSCYPVLKAFGLNGRNPGESEKALIIKWTNSYGFTMDIILDACNRTMKQIHQPSFEYADSILTKWKDRGIKTINDVKSLDEEHLKNKAVHSGKPFTNSESNTDTKNNATKSASKNSFNNFTQRNYNYEALEKELLGNI